MVNPFYRRVWRNGPKSGWFTGSGRALFPFCYQARTSCEVHPDSFAADDRAHDGHDQEHTDFEDHVAEVAHDSSYFRIGALDEPLLRGCEQREGIEERKREQGDPAKKHSRPQDHAEPVGPSCLVCDCGRSLGGLAWHTHDTT